MFIFKSKLDQWYLWEIRKRNNFPLAFMAQVRNIYGCPDTHASYGPEVNKLGV